METFILIFLVCITLIISLVSFFKNLKRERASETQQALDGERVKNEAKDLEKLREELDRLRTGIDTKLDRTTDTLHTNLTSQARESVKMIQDITERLARLDETNKRVSEFGASMRELQDILKNPKQRGVLGEYYLETLLSNVLPAGSFATQYAFKNGEAVDAVVFIKDKIIPIDSKFSLENYNRMIEAKEQTDKDKFEKAFVNDLKTRITETSKYIRPEEGTMDFAFMFIPHEAIYYDLLINKVGAMQNEDTENLIQRAAGKYKVIIVSPTSFLAYLQTVLQGLKAFQIEEHAKDIITRVGELGKHLKTFEDFHGKLGSSLGTVINHYNSATKEFKKIDKDMYRITGNKLESDLPVLEKPEQD